jgi:transposase
VSRNLFWLSDEQWRRIEPHLPTDVRGKDRVDNRRVISGIVHVLKSDGAIAPIPMALRQRSTIASCAEDGARSGKTRSGNSPGVDGPRTCR